MDYEMEINGIKVVNIAIDDLIIQKSIRSSFKNKIDNISEIKNQQSLIIYPSCRNLVYDIELYGALSSLCAQSIDNRFRVLISPSLLELPFIFKHKGSTVKALIQYNPSHIRSSIIKTVLLDGSGDIQQRIDRALYILYSYWFCNKLLIMETLGTGVLSNNFEEVTHNVCIDMENIIATIIDKGFTLYKDYIITVELVEKLRERLMSEKLMNMSDV